jgi:hypothetical protein
VGIGTLPHVIEFYIDTIQRDVPLYWYDTCLKTHPITSSEGVVFSNYDKDIIEFKGLTVVAKKPGKTTVTVTYKGCSAEFKVYIRESGFPINKKDPEIISFKPVEDEITIYKGIAFGANHKKQIRGYIIFEDESWGEAYNDANNEHPNYPAMIPAEKYKMTFESADKNIVRVNNNGVLTAKSAGTTTVTAKLGSHTFTVTVHVVEVPSGSA